MKNYENKNTVGEITELISIERELEKYAHLGAIAEITEMLYYAKNEK